MNKLSLLKYQMRVRNELNKLPREMVKITLEECKKILEKGGKK